MLNVSKPFLRFLLMGLTVAVAALLVTADADAGRLGGGKSFGSRPSYGKSFSMPSGPMGQSGSQREFDSGRQQGYGQQSPYSTPGQGGFSRFGGMGGLLGGLLMGGLLGSLFFGGQGGYGGIGLLDILLIGGGLYLLFRFLASRRSENQGQGQRPRPASYTPASDDRRRDGDDFADMRRTAESGWEMLRTRPAADTSRPSATDRPMAGIPTDFNQDEFLKGAKAAYIRLQESWDRRDLEDIRRFTSPEVYKEIEGQAKDDPSPSKTEILLLDARLLEVKREGGLTIATVQFDAKLREDQRAQGTSQAREIWHFSRGETQTGDNWKLEGIQQVDG